MRIQSENFVEHIKENSNTYNIIIFYGPNYGLVNKLYNDALKILSINMNDPFNVSKLEGNNIVESPHQFEDNISTLSFSIEKRIILLDFMDINKHKKISEIIINSIKKQNNDYLLVIKSNNLGRQHELVKFIEILNNGLIVPCYEENLKDIKTQLINLFNNHQIQFTSEYISELTSKFSTDTSINKMEIKKLEDYLMNNDSINESAILSLIADNLDIDINRIINLCVSGNIYKSLFYFDKMYNGAHISINLVRAFTTHFKLIEKILLSSSNRGSVLNVINNIKPPIFFKNKEQIVFQCRIWTLKKIGIIFKRLIEVELRCKSNAFPEKVILSQFILSTSVMAKKGINP